ALTEHSMAPQQANVEVPVLDRWHGLVKAELQDGVPTKQYGAALYDPGIEVQELLPTQLGDLVSVLPIHRRLCLEPGLHDIGHIVRCRFNLIHPMGEFV